MNRVPIEEVVDDCESALSSSNHGLDAWTVEKMEDLVEWYRDKGYLTDKQEEFLRKLWDKI